MGFRNIAKIVVQTEITEGKTIWLLWSSLCPRQLYSGLVDYMKHVNCSFLRRACHKFCNPVNWLCYCSHKSFKFSHLFSWSREQPQLTPHFHWAYTPHVSLSLWPTCPSQSLKTNKKVHQFLHNVISIDLQMPRAFNDPNRASSPYIGNLRRTNALCNRANELWLADEIMTYMRKAPSHWQIIALTHERISDASACSDAALAVSVSITPKFEIPNAVMTKQQISTAKLIHFAEQKFGFAVAYIYSGLYI